MPDAHFSPPESFLTARLHLRKPRSEDAQLIFAAYAQDPEVTR
jgi:RimJ/RimL family protein N-acetyltransferase